MKSRCATCHGRRPYWQWFMLQESFPITSKYTWWLLTQLPLKSVLKSADYTGRIAKWGTILGAFDIKYMPRTSIKGQVLVVLVAKFAECPEEMDVENHNMGERSVGVVSIQCPMPMGIVCGRSSQPVRIRGGASSSVTRKDHH